MINCASFLQPGCKIFLYRIAQCVAEEDHSNRSKAVLIFLKDAVYVKSEHSKLCIEKSAYRTWFLEINRWGFVIKLNSPSRISLRPARLTIGIYHAFGGGFRYSNSSLRRGRIGEWYFSSARMERKVGLVKRTGEKYDIVVSVNSTAYMWRFFPSVKVSFFFFF